jgi:phosphoribosylglycinamide formyltransferase-1
VTLVDAAPPLDVAVLVSESAARLTALLDASDAGYDVVGAVASHPDGEAVERLRAHDVPTTTVDIEAFYDERDAPLADRTVRRAYDERVASALGAFDPDLVACSGYRFVLTEPVLDRFVPALISAHHADLRLRGEDDAPLYPGLDAVRAALSDGRSSTRETVHVVTEDVDCGPPLVVSRPFGVNSALVQFARRADAEDVLDAYAYAHREWMMRAGGGPALSKAIELLATGRLTLEDGRACVDGESGPFSMGETLRRDGPPTATDAAEVD